MDIILHDLAYDSDVKESIEGLVPLEKIPKLRNNKIVMIDVDKEQHPFWPWVSSTAVGEFEITPGYEDEEFFSQLIEVHLYDIYSFRIDEDGFEIEFADGNIAYFEISLCRCSKVEII